MENEWSDGEKKLGYKQLKDWVKVLEGYNLERTDTGVVVVELVLFVDLRILEWRMILDGELDLHGVLCEGGPTDQISKKCTWII